MEIALIIVVIAVIVFAAIKMSKSKTDDNVEAREISPKQGIENYFNIDILDVFKYSPNLDEIGEKNNNEKYHLRLTKPELGVFNEAEIYYFRYSNTYNLCFESKNCEFTQQMKMLISSIADEYGNDDSGYGHISTEETLKIKNGMFFGRMWTKNKPAIWINYNVFPREMSLSIFGLKNKSEALPVLPIKD